MSHILDPDTFNPNQCPKDPDHDLRNILKHARRRILQLLVEKNYTDGLILLQALISSNKYGVKSFWKIGAELVKRNCPENLADFLYAASISVNGADSMPIFHAWIRQLLLENRQQKALDEIESRMMQEPYYSDPECAKMLALFQYELWEEALDKVPLMKSTLSNLTVAHGLQPNDTRLLAAFLKVMAHQGQDTVDAFAELTLNQQRDDPEWNRILLRHWSEKTSMSWIQHAYRVCQADPVAEPEIIAAPLLESLSAIYRLNNGPEGQRALCLTLSILLDRLEFGMMDEWTVSQLCESASFISMNKAATMQRAAYKLLQSRHALDTLDELLARHDYVVDRFKSELYQCRQIFAKNEKQQYLSLKRKVSRMEKEANALLKRCHLVELSRDDPWGDFLEVQTSPRFTNNSSTMSSPSSSQDSPMSL